MRLHAVLGQIGGVCRSDKVWLKIVDMKLFPVLAFGSHVWDYDRSDVSYMAKGELPRFSSWGQIQDFFILTALENFEFPPWLL